MYALQWLAGSCAFGFKGRVARVTSRAAVAERWVVSVVVVKASAESSRALEGVVGKVGGASMR
jgi:hypothetical protein